MPLTKSAMLKLFPAYTTGGKLRDSMTGATATITVRTIGPNVTDPAELATKTV